MKDIIQKYSYKVKSIIKKFTGEYNEDLEQEVYIKTYKNIDKYTEQNKFASWISIITANLCRDYLKSSSCKKSKLTCHDDETINKITSQDNPEKKLTVKERQKIILKAVNALPKKMKEVVILYNYEDYSYEKIAKKLKVPIGTVKSRINSAKKILKEELDFLIKEEY